MEFQSKVTFINVIQCNHSQNRIIFNIFVFFRVLLQILPAVFCERIRRKIIFHHYQAVSIHKGNYFRPSFRLIFSKEIVLILLANILSRNRMKKICVFSNESTKYSKIIIETVRTMHRHFI